MEKTNVMRILDKEHIKYQAYDYTKLNVISGMDVAASLGEDFNHVFKTLVTVAKSGNHYVFVLPVNKELDLKKCAKAVNEKKYCNGIIEKSFGFNRIYSWWLLANWYEEAI